MASRKAPALRKTPASRKTATFGHAYFRRYYIDPKTRVTTHAEMHARALLIAGVLRHSCVPVRRILDAGCGIGLLKGEFAKVLPRARYRGLESSDYLCGRYGWIMGSVVDYRPRLPSDLVVCYDVLQYLDDKEASLAIANLAHLTRAALYLSALTLEDWRDNCDQGKTDRAVHLRRGDWYRRRLRRNFRYLGFGVWVRKDVTTILWDLEKP